jgi:putative transposase
VNAVTEIAPLVGIVLACAMLAVARATYYRSLQPRTLLSARQAPVRALGPGERQAVLDVLHEPRFVDLAPSEVYATLLDEQRYLCSERTMYRILAANQEVRERRDQLRHSQPPTPRVARDAPQRAVELGHHQAARAAEVDVLLPVRDPRRLQPLRRRLVGGDRGERGARPQAHRGDVPPSGDHARPTHASRRSRQLDEQQVRRALLLADLGVAKTHSRPYVSNDNPFSESAFKTLKYRPGFPERFGHVEHARSHCGPLFDWYNGEHRHGSLGLCTPHDVHYGLAAQTLQGRAAILDAAFAAHPERFTRGRPSPAAPPAEVWINKPTNAPEEVAVQPPGQ